MRNLTSLRWPTPTAKSGWARRGIHCVYCTVYAKTYCGRNTLQEELIKLNVAGWDSKRGNREPRRRIVRDAMDCNASQVSNTTHPHLREHAKRYTRLKITRLRNRWYKCGIDEERGSRVEQVSKRASHHRWTRASRRHVGNMLKPQLILYQLKHRRHC